ncbi:MAG: peptidylprolyl isomerase [Deltaproteobacteria bacterium]|nr:peptidylprolyl isomerase [Deltaproteobacteria bacterium]
MKIQNNSFVAVQYTLTLDSGEVADKSEPNEPLCFLQGAGMILPGFEKNLDGLEVGQSVKFTVEAEDGYGKRSDEMIIEVPRSRFPDDVELKPGMMFAGPGGRSFSVAEVAGDTVKVDANHPLAGERLHFDVKVQEVREATEEDLEAFGGGGCGSGCESCGHHGHGEC